MDGIFGNLFDFDGDGKLDSLEQAADFLAFEEIMKDDSEDEQGNEDDEY